MTAERRPWPPLVRWIVAPAFLVCAGAGAGYACGFLWGPPADRAELTAVGGAFAAGGAFGSAVSRNLWLAALMAVLIGIPIMAEAHSRTPSGRVAVPLGTRAWMTMHARVVPGLVAGFAGLAVANVLAQGPLKDRWISAWAIHAAAGLGWPAVLVAAALSQGSVPDRWGPLAVFGLGLGLSQAAALAASRLVASRLERRRSAS